MSNRIIATTGRMLIEGKTLAQISAYLDPFERNPDNHPHCVVQEAWRMAKRQARVRKPPQPTPPKKERGARKPRLYRGELRNRLFGRPNVGNRIPRGVLRQRSL